MSFDINLNKLTYHSKIKNLTHSYINKHKNHSQIISKFEEDFESSVNLRLQSDRKVGILLSGGVDSSLIASFIKKEDLSKYKFYTIFNCDNNNNSDLNFSKKISTFLGVDLKTIPVSYNFEKFNEVIKKITINLEIPVNFHSTAFPTYYIAKMMNEDNINVSVDGIGGDEIMGGYPGYVNQSIGSLRNN